MKIHEKILPSQLCLFLYITSNKLSFLWFSINSSYLTLPQTWNQVLSHSCLSLYPYPHAFFEYINILSCLQLSSYTSSLVPYYFLFFKNVFTIFLLKPFIHSKPKQFGFLTHHYINNFSTATNDVSVQYYKCRYLCNI